MHALADRIDGHLVSVDDELEREFEARLVESARLAFRVAYGVLRNQADAEDVAQEAFAKAHRSFAQLRDRDRFRAWLVRITWRIAIDRRRADRRRGFREAAHARLAPTSTSPCEADEREAALWRAVDALPEKLRVVVVLANVEGHAVREIAALLQVPEGTVKSRLFDARQILKEQLT
jgi:RNA polymerase sigma-70 factor (ECF subfamily)